jgi:putative tRNA adenosine deaminase-associated protein
MADDPTPDFALAAYREEGRWEVTPLPRRATTGVTELVAALRQLPADSGALGLVSVGDDFCLIARTSGHGEVRLLLSDNTAADDWPIAAEVLDAADEDEDEDDDEGPRPAGDLDIAADLGLDPMEASAILGDLDLYPDEMLARVAERLGFGEEFDRAVDTTAR